jgi:hypothetical protein
VYTFIAYTARSSRTIFRFGNAMDWHACACFTLEVSEYFIHQLSGQPVWKLAPAMFTFHVLYTSRILDAECQQFSSRKHGIHTICHKYSMHMKHEHHCCASERTASD